MKRNTKVEIKITMQSAPDLNQSHPCPVQTTTQAAKRWVESYHRSDPTGFVGAWFIAGRWAWLADLAFCAPGIGWVPRDKVRWTRIRASVGSWS